MVNFVGKKYEIHSLKATESALWNILCKVIKLYVDKHIHNKTQPDCAFHKDIES